MNSGIMFTEIHGKKWLNLRAFALVALTCVNLSFPLIYMLSRTYNHFSFAAFKAITNI